MSLEFWVFDKPVVGHDKLGAAAHSSVDQDARFEPILSIFGTESCWLYTFSYSIITNIFIAKIKRNFEKTFSRNANILWKPWKELVEFCSDILLFKVLLCHINNFSFFTLINVWWREYDFNSYRLKFFYVSYFFLQNFHFTFFATFSHNFFYEIFVLFSLRNFRTFREQFKAKFSENKYFRERTIWNNEAKWSQKNFRKKCWKHWNSSNKII